MDELEKSDLILRELYNCRTDGKYHSISAICQALNIPLDSLLEMRDIVSNLKEDRFISAYFTMNDYSAVLTSDGIEYFEGNF